MYQTSSLLDPIHISYHDNFASRVKKPTTIFSTIDEFTPKLMNTDHSIRDVFNSMQNRITNIYNYEAEWSEEELFASHRAYVKSSVREKIEMDDLATLSKEELFDFTDRAHAYFLQFKMQTTNFYHENGFVDLRNHFDLATRIISLPNADMTHMNLAQDVICMCITTASVNVNLALMQDFLKEILRVQKRISSLIKDFGNASEHTKRLGETCRSNFLKRTSTGFVRASMHGMNDMQQACIIVELECRRSLVDAMYMTRFLQTILIDIPLKQSFTKTKKRDYGRSTNEMCLRFQDIDLLCCPGNIPECPSSRPRGPIIGGFWLNPRAYSTPNGVFA